MFDISLHSIALVATHIALAGFHAISGSLVMFLCALSLIISDTILPETLQILLLPVTLNNAFGLFSLPSHSPSCLSASRALSYNMLPSKVKTSWPVQLSSWGEEVIYARWRTGTDYFPSLGNLELLVTTHSVIWFWGSTGAFFLFLSDGVTP